MNRSQLGNMVVKSTEAADNKETYFVYIIDHKPTKNRPSAFRTTKDVAWFKKPNIAILGILKDNGRKIWYEGQEIDTTLFNFSIPLNWLIDRLYFRKDIDFKDEIKTHICKLIVNVQALIENNEECLQKNFKGSYGYIWLDVIAIANWLTHPVKEIDETWDPYKETPSKLKEVK